MDRVRSGDKNNVEIHLNTSKNIIKNITKNITKILLY